MARSRAAIHGPGPYAKELQTEPLSDETRFRHDNNDISRDALPNTAHSAFFFVPGEYLSA
jgi:hypothetical protein